MAHKFLAVKKHFQFVHVKIKVITIVNDVQKVIEWNNFSQQLMMKSFTSIANYMYYVNMTGEPAPAFTPRGSTSAPASPGPLPLQIKNTLG